MRQKLRINWKAQLVADSIAEEEGFHNRLFKQTGLYRYYLSWWDYPDRSHGWSTRCWKKYRKTQYK